MKHSITSSLADLLSAKFLHCKKSSSLYWFHFNFPVFQKGKFHEISNTISIKKKVAVLFCLMALAGCVTKHPLENKYRVNKISDEEYRKKGLIPIGDFFKNSEISGFSISPNGKYLAYLKPYKKRMNIHIREIASDTEKRITDQTDRDVLGFAWKEDETILYFGDYFGDENIHIFRTSIDGKNKKNLTPFRGTKVGIVDWLENISKDTILIQMNKRNKRFFDVYRLNIKTGDLKKIAKNPGHYTGWMTDHDGKLRVAVGTDGVNKSLYYRDTEKEDFKEIFSSNFKTTFSPMLFDFDNKRFYVSTNVKRDKSAIKLFDPKTRSLSTLFSHPEVDVGYLGWSRKDKKITSITYTTWKTQRKWLDSKWEKIHRNIEKHFPGKEVRISSLNRDEDKAVVITFNDRNPGSYYFYNIKSKELKKIGDPRPWLKEESLVEMKPIQYKSRDGLTIHGYLTLPKGSSGKKLPLVVNPHGGPWARNGWGYNPEVQFLANRGYAVLQMNFRGSTGYGKKFWQASFKQWGKTMQDDITDGVMDLIEKGIADKDKICIYGGSYGGYAVLAGLAFTPNLYACGVDLVGVSNLFTFQATIPPYWKQMRKMLHEMVGHPEKDKALLRSASPVFHADRIKAPLLVAQGANDPRVKKSESDQIVSSLHKRGIEPLYMVKYNEGHGFRLEENRMEFYRLMESFLEKHLRKSSEKNKTP